MVWLIIIAALAAAAVVLIIRNSYELSHLKVVSYDLASSKIEEGNSLRAVFITDLHGCSYGTGNSTLLELIGAQKPDVIFIGGDIINGGFDSKDETSFNFIEDVSKIAKVYYAPGNHEKLIKILTANEMPEVLHAPGKKRTWTKSFFEEREARLEEIIERCGITYLENTGAELNESITVLGLDLEMKYYEKIAPAKPDMETINMYLGSRDESKYNILLAHNPEFFELYAGYGSDLVLSGHYHGGTIRLPVVGGVMSPRGVVFPKYSHGEFKKKDTTLIVSAGCGQHHLNVRLGNRPEVVVLNIGESK